MFLGISSINAVLTDAEDRRVFPGQDLVEGGSGCRREVHRPRLRGWARAVRSLPRL